MDENVLRAVLGAAVRTATEQTRRDFQTTIDELTARLTLIERPVQVEEYREIAIDPTVRCDESLDVVKSLPEFNGDHSRYVSWRQAAHTAYKIFENAQGSSKHYQAVAIIRNKVVGSADATLSSFNTILNFKAIIARLDFTYSDKKPVYILEQEMSTLRQGRLSITAFYDEVGKKLTAIINKNLMTYENKKDVLESLNTKYRQDALRVFISGLNHPLCDILFSSRPADMASALALAQELESNQTRSLFAQRFSDTKFPANDMQSRNFTGMPLISPHFFRQSGGQPQQRPISRPTPMDVDPSLSKLRYPTQNIGSNFKAAPQVVQPSTSSPIARNFPSGRTAFGNQYPRNIITSDTQQAQKRQRDSDRANLNKIQRLNHLGQSTVTDDINGDPNCYYQPEYFDDHAYNENSYADCPPQEETTDEINFLGVDPCYHTLAGHSEGSN